MTSWGSPNAAKFRKGASNDTPWNWHLNWQNYVQKEKSYLGTRQHKASEHSSELERSAHLHATGVLSSHPRTKQVRPQQKRTIFGVAGSFISTDLPPSPISARHNQMQSSALLDPTPRSARRPMRTPRSAMYSQRSRQSHRPTSRGSYRGGGGGGGGGGATGRSIWSRDSRRGGASSRYGRPTSAAATSARQLEELESKYIQEMQRRKDMEMRVLALSAQIQDLKKNVSDTQHRAVRYGDGL